MRYLVNISHYAKCLNYSWVYGILGVVFPNLIFLLYSYINVKSRRGGLLKGLISEHKLPTPFICLKQNFISCNIDHLKAKEIYIASQTEINWDDK